MGKSVDLVKQMVEPPSDDVLEAVHAVMHAFRARQHKAQADLPHGLTHFEGKVLGFFARHPGSTQTELAAHSGRDKGQLGRLIAGLRERGLLLAVADQGDRRVVRLRLSAEGEAAQRVLQRHRRRLSADAASGLTADERRLLVALLDRVRQQLEPEG